MTKHYINITKEKIEGLDSVNFKLLTNDGEELYIVSKNDYQLLSSKVNSIENNNRDYITQQISSVINSLQSGEYVLDYAIASGKLKETEEANSDEITFQQVQNLITLASDLSQRLSTAESSISNISNALVPATTNSQGLVKVDNSPSSSSSNDGFTHTVTSNGIYNALNGKANTSHTHTVSQISDYYIYEIIPSNYNPNIGDKITLTLRAKKPNGTGVQASGNLNVTSTQYNNVDKYSLSNYNQTDDSFIYGKLSSLNSSITTNSSGEYVITDFPILAWGVIDIEWKGVHCRINATGTLHRGDNFNNPTWLICRNENTGMMRLNGWKSSSSSTDANWVNGVSNWIGFGGSNNYCSKMKPLHHKIGVDSYAMVYFRIEQTGHIKFRSVKGTVNSNTSFSGCVIDWVICNDDLNNYVVKFTNDGNPYLQL